MPDWTHIANRLGFESEMEMWLDLYREKEKTINQLSIAFRVGTTTINRRLKMYGVVMRPKGGANNVQGHTRRLLLIDPRLLFTLPEPRLAGMVGVHPSTVYTLKRSLRRLP